MSGNVWEWCLNTYDRPWNNWLFGDFRRVVRGGSWLGDLVLARASSRDNYAPGPRGDDLGLRVVRSSPSLA